MLNNIIFSLNIVLPLVLLAAIGYGAKRVGLVSDGFLKGGNKVIFYLAIPATLFNSLYATNLGEIFDPGFVGFVAIWTITSFAIIWLLTWLALRKHHPTIISAWVNGAHRGNLAMLGLPLLISILGEGDYAAKVAMAAAIIIPLYNIQTILLLTVTNSDGQAKLGNDVAGDYVLPGKSRRTKNVIARVTTIQKPRAIRPEAIQRCKFPINANIHFLGNLALGIIKNPPIIGVALGLAAATLGISLPTIAEQTIGSLAALTIPLALLCLGGAMTFKGFDTNFKFALTSGLIKVVALPIVTIALAAALGFRGNDLTILMILHGVPTAVGSYVMLAEMGGNTYVAGTNIMLTTVLSAFTLSLLIFVFRTAGIIL